MKIGEDMRLMNRRGRPTRPVMIFPSRGGFETRIPLPRQNVRI